MKKYKKAKRYYYFRNQKLLGVVLLLCATVLANIIDGEIMASILVASLGLYLVFTKERITYGDYFYEMQNKECNEEEDS